MGKVVIIPTCDDSNRGDQALVWETRRVAAKAGYGTEFFMVSDSNDSHQTVAEGIQLLAPILRHPEKRYKPASNLRYGPVLFAIWGLISVFDLMRSAVYLTSVGRFLFGSLMSVGERETLRTLEESEACFVKGGGFIHSTRSVTDAYRAYYSLFHVYLAQSLGKPVFVMPNSFGPFDGVLFRRLVRRALVRCQLVTARESISLDMLNEIGVQAELFPDLAFSLEPSANVKSSVARLRDDNPREPLVGITVRPYRFPGSADPSKAYQTFISEMSLFATWLSENGYVPVFVEHVRSSGAHESDMNAITAVMAKMPKDVGSVIADVSFNCRDLMSIYGECDYVVGTRFHSFIFALTQGTPALAVAYGGNKGQGIMKDIGLSDLVINIEDFSKDEAILMFSRMVRARDLSTDLIGIREKARAAHTDLILRIQEFAKHQCAL